MNTPHTCPLELEVLATIGSTMSEDLSNHLKNCESCREAKTLAESLRRFAARAIPAPPPDPDIIWIMARLSKPPARWTSETVTGIAALVATAIWIGPAISVYLSGIVPGSATTAHVFLTSCVVAAAIAGVAARTLRRLTGE